MQAREQMTKVYFLICFILSILEKLLLKPTGSLYLSLVWCYHVCNSYAQSDSELPCIEYIYVEEPFRKVVHAALRGHFTSCKLKGNVHILVTNRTILVREQ